MEHENSQISQYEPTFKNPSSSQASLLGMDRISALDNPILHNIFRFIPTREVARTSILSTRFDKLWLSYPILDLNDFDHPMSFSELNMWHDDPSFKQQNLLSTRVKQFNARDDFPMLKKLKISVMKQNINKGFDEELPSEIDQLIFKVAQGDTLEKMDLRFRVLDSPLNPIVLSSNPFIRYYDEFYMLPILPVFSWSKSLQHLKLVGCRFEGGLAMHEGIIFPSLKKLYIKLCKVGEDSITELINGCPKLEEFSFKYCLLFGALRFSSASLKHLVLGFCVSSTVLEICLPSLERFKFAGKCVGQCLGVKFMPHHVICAQNLQILSFKCVTLDAKVIKIALLRGFKNLKELLLKCCYFEDKPKFGGEKLEKLKITDCWFENKSLIISPLSLPLLECLAMHSCQKLEKLVIESSDLGVSVEECPDLVDICMAPDE